MTRPDGRVLQSFSMFDVHNFGYFTSRPKNEISLTANYLFYARFSKYQEEQPEPYINHYEATIEGAMLTAFYLCTGVESEL